MSVIDYGAIIFRNGDKIENLNLQYYYNKKQKKYIGANINETTEEMFQSFLKQNGNISYPEKNSFVISLDNKCLVFHKNLKPVFYINGNIGKLYELEDGGYKDHSGEITLRPFFTDEFDGEVIGYQISYKEDRYLIIYGYLVNDYDRKHLFKMLDNRLTYDEDTKAYRLFIGDCDYDLLLDYVIRKDMKRSFRKELVEAIKHRESFDKIKEIFNNLKMLY